MRMSLPIKFMTISGAILTAISVAEYGYNYAITNWNAFQFITNLVF